MIVKKLEIYGLKIIQKINKNKKTVFCLSKKEGSLSLFFYLSFIKIIVIYYIAD